MKSEIERQKNGRTTQPSLCDVAKVAPSNVTNKGKRIPITGSDQFDRDCILYLTSQMSSSIPLSEIRLNEPRFLDLLEKLVGESEFLQNSPHQGLIPKEDLAIKHVLDILSPLSTENHGPLVIEKVNFVEGRGNLIIKYPGTTDAVCSFIGSHMDVVPADKSSWARNPFSLTQEGDILYGRGTTDCLGHVAVLTDLLASLGTER